jgi:hypothetical protein
VPPQGDYEEEGRLNVASESPQNTPNGVGSHESQVASEVERARRRSAIQDSLHAVAGDLLRRFARTQYVSA